MLYPFEKKIRAKENFCFHKILLQFYQKINKQALGHLPPINPSIVSSNIGYQINQRNLMQEQNIITSAKHKIAKAY